MVMIVPVVVEEDSRVSINVGPRVLDLSALQNV
jgi:hypothetical protein